MAPWLCPVNLNIAPVMVFHDRGKGLLQTLPSAGMNGAERGGIELL